MGPQAGTLVGPSNGGAFTLLIVCSINESKRTESKQNIILLLTYPPLQLFAPGEGGVGV